MNNEPNIQTQHQILADSAINDGLNEVLIPIKTTGKIHKYIYQDQCSGEIKKAIQYETETIYLDSRGARHQE